MGEILAAGARVTGKTDFQGRRDMSRLVYVMGASGCGKDSCMGFARERLPAGAPVVFAHRYITRPADSGGENHVALSPEEFDLRQRQGLFSLSWQSHGKSYGVGREIDIWMEAGLTVVVNGSREYFPQAARLYPSILPVEVCVSPEVAAMRLAARGRETPAEAKERLRRGGSLSVSHPKLTRIDNSGPLDVAGQALLALIAPCSGP